MAGIADRVRVRLNEARIRRHWLDHLLRTFAHYGQVQGNAHAGGVTFFGFLSVFPLLALAFFTVGLITRYTGASLNVVQAINSVLPGLVGTGEGQIRLSDIETAASAAGLIGVVGLLYAGLNVLSGMRTALLIVFEQPEAPPSFVVGKLRDLLTLVVLGAVLLLSVVVSSVVNILSTFVLGLVGLDDDLRWLLRLLTVPVGVGVSTLLFFALFRILGRPLATTGGLVRGALLAALAFEALKQASAALISSTQSQPSAAVFGVALVLLVWINYTARVTLIAASWVHTGHGARLLRQQREAAERARADATAVELRKQPPAGSAAGGPRSFAAGALAAMGGIFLLQRRNRFRAKNRT